MVEEFWDDMIELLMPNVTIFSLAEEKRLRQLIWKAVDLNDMGYVDWGKKIKHVRISNPSQIASALGELSQSSLNMHDQIIYISAPYAFDYIIKTRLDSALKYYHNIRWTGKMWVWSPTAGYVVEDLGFGNITIGLIPKQPDPYPHFIAHKDSTKWNSARLIRLLHRFTAQANTTFLDDDKANKILSFFKSKFPLTSAEKIDWDKIEKKVTVGRDPGKIIPALEQLLEKPVSMIAYVNWCDTDLPLVKVDLRDAISRYDQIVAVAGETVIFNPTARYVIEVDDLGNITVGVLTQHKD